MIGNTKKRSRLLIFLSILLSVSGCTDFNVEPCETVYYLFDLDLTIAPSGNLYSIGDTILIYSQIGSTLIDEKSGTPITCGDSFLFPLTLDFNQFDSSSISSTNDDFEVLESKGTINIREEFGGIIDVSYRLNSENNSRELELFFIPVKAGIYTLSFHYHPLIYSDGFLNNNTDESCTKENAELIFNTNNRENLGFELIADSGYFNPSPEDGFNEAQYLESGRYSFEVVE